MTHTKAKIASVNFLGESVEMLLLPNQEFAIAASQFSTVFSLLKNNATRDVKALLGKDISLLLSP